MGPERDERLYLVDMRDAVERILRYTSGGRAAFLADPMTPSLRERLSRLVPGL